MDQSQIVQHKARSGFRTVVMIGSLVALGYAGGRVHEAHTHGFEIAQTKAKIMKEVASGRSWKPGADPEFFRNSMALMVDEQENVIYGVNIKDGAISQGFYHADGSVRLSPGEHIFDNFKKDISNMYHSLEGMLKGDDQ